VKPGFRNAAIRVVSNVFETVIAMHGVGYLAWESISKNGFPVMQAVILVLALTHIAPTLLADLMNAALDPQPRRS